MGESTYLLEVCSTSAACLYITALECVICVVQPDPRPGTTPFNRRSRDWDRESSWKTKYEVERRKVSK